MHPEEHFLRQILGAVAGQTRLGEERKDQVLVVIDQLSERLLVTGPAAPDNLVLAEGVHPLLCPIRAPEWPDCFSNLRETIPGPVQSNAYRTEEPMFWGDQLSGVLAVMIPIVAIAGAFLVGALKIYSQMRVRELEIRQRIAMIEKGLVPPPEVDPARFERTMAATNFSDMPFGRSSRRYRSSGVTLIGVGLGLMILIGFAGGSPETGMGVGGFLAVLGLAFFVNSRLERRHEVARAAVSPQPPDRPAGPLS